MRRFLRDTRAGATAVAAVAVVVMIVGGLALVTDHVWLVGKRDGLKTAADAAAVAATLELHRRIALDPAVGDEALEAALEVVARRYILLNMGHLTPARYRTVVGSLAVALEVDRAQGTVGVTASADLGGTLLASRLPLFAGFRDPEVFRAAAGVEAAPVPVNLVLAIDVSGSMVRCLGGGYPCPDARQRMSIVKRAATSLVDVLDPRPETGVSIAIVPWHSQVRLGSDTRARWETEGWAEYPRRRRYGMPYVCNPPGCPPESVVEDLPLHAPEGWRGCLDQSRMTPGGLATLPDPSDFLAPPGLHPFAQTFFPAGHGVSYRCLAAPLPGNYYLQDCYDELQLQDGRQTWKEDPQPSCGQDTPTLLPLSSDRDRIEASIRQLRPDGGKRTHSSLGVLWGQRLLAPSWKDVWGDAVDPPSADEAPRTALVLLTDGQDTQCGALGAATSCKGSPAGIARSAACAAAKEAGTEIYVVAAMAPAHVSGALAEALRACSSESDDPDGAYVFLNNATPENLEAAFDRIAHQVQSVRRVY